MPFTKLRFHFIFATKNRAPWIDDKLEGFIYPIIVRAAERNGGNIIQLGGVEDHMHAVCGLQPTVAPSDFVDRIKSESAGAVRRCFKDRKSFKWQVGYGCFSLNAHDFDRVVSYVANQKEHHRKDELWELYETIEEVEDDDESGEDNEGLVEGAAHG